MAKSYRTHVSPKTGGVSPVATKQMAKEAFARLLYQLMTAKGWRQADLARASGLTRNSISVYMRAGSMPDPDSLKALAKTFNKEPQDLLPNYVEGAIEKDNPELEFRVSPGDPKTALLRINKIVPTSLALKILAMLEESNAS